MRTTIDELIAKLTEFRKANADLATTQAQHDALSEQVSTLQESLSTARADLASAQSGLSAHQAKNLKKFQEDIFNRTKELEGLNASVRDARTRLDTVNIDIESATAKHRQIEDSLTNLRKQHFG